MVQGPQLLVHAAIAIVVLVVLIARFAAGRRAV